MALTEFLFLIPGPAGLSAFLTLTILVTVLYVAREPFHQAALAVGTALHRGFRLSASFVSRAEVKLVERNREVLLANRGEATERAVEREFERIQGLVERDLKAYPKLHRRLSEQIQRIDEEVLEGADAPEAPSVWIEAVGAVAKLRDAAGPEVAAVLGDIHKSMARAQSAAVREYRRAERARHRRLGRMRPAWRRVESVLERVGRDVNALRDRSKRLDVQMEEVREITRGTDRVVQRLESSSMTRFLVALLVLSVAFGGALVNFYLIAHPMQGIVGGSSVLGAFLLADAAAIVLIMIALFMGLFLMEALRITHMIPVIGWLDDRNRRRLGLGAFGSLLILATLGSLLALTRETLPAAGPTQTLTGLLTVPIVVQMALAFILPLALAFVAIPLESLFSSGRTVAGIILVGMLRALRVGLRTLGALGRGLMRMVPILYDLLIFAPLWVERMVLLRRQAVRGAEGGSEPGGLVAGGSGGGAG